MTIAGRVSRPTQARIRQCTQVNHNTNQIDNTKDELSHNKYKFLH